MDIEFNTDAAPIYSLYRPLPLQSAPDDDLKHAHRFSGFLEVKEGTTGTTVPTRSMLKPPKLAPSAWQLFFTHWIYRRQIERGDEKLNVAQAAKEAGAVYAVMTEEEKEVVVFLFPFD